MQATKIKEWHILVFLACNHFSNHYLPWFIISNFTNLRITWSQLFTLPKYRIKMIQWCSPSFKASLRIKGHQICKYSQRIWTNYASMYASVHTSIWREIKREKMLELMGKMLTSEESGWKVYKNSLYYFFCNFSASLKLFHIKNILKVKVSSELKRHKWEKISKNL